MKKYTHAKESTKQLSTKQQKALDIRKASDEAGSLVVTVERQFGFFTPEFGGAWGSSYNRVTGAISKNYRAKAVA
jgi:hypothetical protein